MEDSFSPVFSALLDSLLLRSQVYSWLFACSVWAWIRCSLFCSCFVAWGGKGGLYLHFPAWDFLLKKIIFVSFFFLLIKSE